MAIVKTFIFLTILSMLMVTSGVSAVPNSNGKLQAAQNDVKAYKKILKRLAKLSPAVLQSLLAKNSVATLTDSDSDGLPDLFEDFEDTDACDDDSDNDGISDGDEGNGGSDPGDDDEGEINITGAITAITSTTVTVGSYTCTTDGSSTFGDKSGLADYIVGDNVELECELKSSVLTLKHISEED